MIRCSTSSAQGRSGDIGPWSTLIGASIGTERRCAHGCRTPWYPHLLGITAPGAVCACPLAVQLDASVSQWGMAMAMLVPGTVPADYMGLHPADDLARCLRYYEIVASGSGPATVGQAQSATQAQTILAYTQKPVAPTLTVSANSDFQLLNAAAGSVVCTGFAPQNTTVNRMQVLVSVASGLVAGNATYMGGINANSKMMLEANP